MAIKLGMDDLDDLMSAGFLTHPDLPPPPQPTPEIPGVNAPPPHAAPVMPAFHAPIVPSAAQEKSGIGKSEFRAGMPTISEADPSQPAFFKQREAVNQYEKQHPWGSPVSEHPGFAGKVGHALATAGNIAGDIFAPAQTSIIPGSQLNRERQTEQNTEGADKAQEIQTAKEGVEQKPEIAEAQGELRGQIEANKDQAAQERAQEGIQSREKIAGEGNEVKQDIAKEGNQTREDLSQQGIYSREKVAKLHDDTERLIAQEREAGANARAAIAQDPNKLTNTMKTMKQQAQATLPGIDRALQETSAVKDLLGPGAGRWNDFIQGKIGISDPRYAHYRDEIGLVSSAVTLAHARGRMSGELYNHFQQMFDAGKQDPDNMIQALDVAKEWLGDYATMGDTPAGGATPAPAAGGGFKAWQAGHK